MGKTTPKWGEGKTLLGLFNHPEESARSIIPEDYTDDDNPDPTRRPGYQEDKANWEAFTRKGRG